VVEDYVTGLLSKGLLQGVRGACWAMIDPRDAKKRWLITFGTLTHAIYIAHKRDPTNPFIIEALATGIRGCTEFHQRTPVDVVRFLRDVHNDFHKGSKYSIETLFLVHVSACI
jgi:hypothetical protein